MAFKVTGELSNSLMSSVSCSLRIELDQRQREAVMAFVKELLHSDHRPLRIQPTQVVCRFSVDEIAAGQRVIQLDTHGSDQREIPGKVSQTLQLDEARARHLWEILGREFGFS